MSSVRRTVLLLAAPAAVALTSVGCGGGSATVQQTGSPQTVAGTVAATPEAQAADVALRYGKAFWSADYTGAMPYVNDDRSRQMLQLLANMHPKNPGVSTDLALGPLTVTGDDARTTYIGTFCGKNPGFDPVQSASGTGSVSPDGSVSLSTATSEGTVPTTGGPHCKVSTAASPDPLFAVRLHKEGNGTWYVVLTGTP